MIVLQGHVGTDGLRTKASTHAGYRQREKWEEPRSLMSTLSAEATLQSPTCGLIEIIPVMVVTLAALIVVCGSVVVPASSGMLVGNAES